MARVLVTGPQSTPQDRAVLERIAGLARELGHEPRVAGRAPMAAAPQGPNRSPELYRATLNLLQSCDALIAVLDGAEPDASTVAEIAIARSLRRPVLGLRGDERRAQGWDGVPPAVRALVEEVVAVPAWDAPETRTHVGGFLRNVRIFAGNLVRDAVPKILKDEGRELRFRQVDEPEYPRVLKRKLVETAQRLEESDFGVEQEEIADLLELLETLINLRKYDKESLRSIKEGKWRKRGGFQKGFLLEEEPPLSSR